MSTNYYEILGLLRDAPEKNIRQNFRRLARKYHPDLNPNDKEAERKFKEINEAYEVLSDPDRRSKYDKYGDQWKYADQIEQQRSSHTSGRSYGSGSSAGFNPFGDIGDLFGGFGRRWGASTTTSVRPRTEVQTDITLEEAFTGTKRLVRVFTDGRDRRIEVSIPCGVDTGSTVHLTLDHGLDLYLKVTVRPHARFSRKGIDLYVEVDIPLEDVILGGETRLKTITGKVALKVPQNAVTGQQIRLTGQGMPKLNGHGKRGDLYVVIRPEMPIDLSEEEQDLIVQYKKLRSGRK